MFESTLEAQALHQGERKFGALSVAVLAHVGLALAVVAVTASIVPQVITPEPSETVFPIATVIPAGDVTPKPVAAPKKAASSAAAERDPTPPSVASDAPPSITPDSLPSPEPVDGPAGPELPGIGSGGDPNGGALGVPGGIGDAGDGDGGPARGDGVNPLELTGDMVPPVLIEKVAPSYPRVARQAGLGGRVTVRAVIAPDGSVESVEVSSSTNPLFNDAAVEAVRRWRYRPASMNGRPVRVYFAVVVDFLVR